MKSHNHMHTWGSYWKDWQWGYKCCHSFIKYCYCTGGAWKESFNSEECIINDVTGEESVMKPQTLMQLHHKNLKEEKKKKKKKHQKRSSHSGEDRKHEKLKKSLKAKETRLLHVKESMKIDERKRPSSSTYENLESTEEEMEAYRMKGQRTDDPMASFLG